jgi:hypothetical protein
MGAAAPIFFNRKERIYTMDYQAPEGFQLIPDTVVRSDFSYSISFPAIAPGQTLTGSIQIQADSDFITHNQTMSADINGAPQTESGQVVPLIEVMLIDTGSGRQLYDRPLSINSQFGNARLPYILPRQRYSFARSTIQVQVTNRSAATTYNNLNLVFNGEKVFVYSHNN